MVIPANGQFHWIVLSSIVLQVFVGRFGGAHITKGAVPALVRVVDGSTTGNTGLTFRNVGYSDGRQTFYASQNPIIHGHNLYAIDLIRATSGAGPHWRGYLGGWKSSGQVNDRIYLSTTPSLDVNGPWTDPQAIITEGRYLHVNDPSVVVVNGAYHMTYTAADFVNDPTFGSYFRDWINYSTSSDGVNWTPNAGVASAEIELTDPLGLAPGTLTSIARPSMVKTDAGWKLWFDGRTDNQTPDSAIHSYLAHSIGDSPTEFEVVKRYPDIGGFPGFFEPDVVLRPDGTYLAVVQRNFNELWQATSNDGINFTFVQKVYDGDDTFYPRERMSNPGLIYDQLEDENYGVGFGIAGTTLADHDIGFAYSQFIVQVRSPSQTPGGQPVWHVFASAVDFDQQELEVFGFTEFDLVRVIDPTTAAIVLEQDFTNAGLGDTWELRFQPELPGDYNGDLSVNAADYIVWRKTLGQSGVAFEGADGDGDGQIGQGDYEIWRKKLGATIATSKSAEPLLLPEPEPHILAFATVAIFFACVRLPNGCRYNARLY